MQDSHFLRLPAELLDSVFSLVFTKDCKALRLTCRSFSSLATRWVFKDIYVTVLEVEGQKLHDSKGFQRLVDKYGHLVRKITVDGRQGQPINRSRQLLTYMGSLPLLPLDPGNFQRPSAPQYSILHRASLMTPPELRILPNLRCLEVSITSLTVGETGHPFLVIPSVETLVINGLKLDTFNFEGLTEHHGQTNLKSLTLNWPFINLKALRNVLMFPKALTHLNIQCCSQLFWCWNPAWSSKQLASALAVQRDSLEVLKLGETERALEIKMLADAFGAVHIPEEGFAGYEFDLSVFPRLREYQGFYPDSSGKFKHCALEGEECAGC